MRFNFLGWEIRIRKEDKDAQKVRAVLKDPDYEDLLEEMNLKKVVRDYIKDEHRWVSWKEVMKKFSLRKHGIDSTRDLVIPYYEFSFWGGRERIESKRKGKGDESKTYFKYSCDRFGSYMILIALSLTILNILSMLLGVTG